MRKINLSLFYFVQLSFYCGILMHSGPGERYRRATNPSKSAWADMAWKRPPRDPVLTLGGEGGGSALPAHTGNVKYMYI
jgi:hypothetical protein